MQICITVDTGEGPTTLAALDAALLNAGVVNYNPIALSSAHMVPSNTRSSASSAVIARVRNGYRSV